MFEITAPWILLLLPLPFLVSFLFSEKTAHPSVALHVPFYERLKTLLEENTLRRGFFSPALWGLFFIWCFFVFAASGPVYEGNPIILKRTGRSILLTMDISGSMEIPDMTLEGQEVSRLDALQETATQFIEERPGDAIGLILFGTYAYLQTPLTYDHDTLISMLKDATVGLAGPQTAIGDALGLSIKQFMNAPKPHPIIILLTDGINNAGHVSALSAATMAKKHGIKIYTIGFGSDHAVVESLFGPQQINPSQDLDEPTLKKIAALTGGHYFRAKDTQSLEAVYDELNRLEPTTQDEGTFRPVTPLFMWPLGIGLLGTVLLLLWPLLKNRREVL